jgi:hypothetical protein
LHRIAWGFFMRNQLAAVSISFMFYFGLVVPAQAAYMYTYAGNTFDSFYTDGYLSYSESPPPSYDNTMSVGGYFVVMDEIGQGDGMGMEVLHAQRYSFTDGIHTLTQDNSEIELLAKADAEGNLIRWNVSIYDKTEIYYYYEWMVEKQISITTKNLLIGDSVDYGSTFDCTDGFHDGACGNPPWINSGSTENLGTWTSSFAIPVPAAVWLFASGLGALGVVRRRKSAGVN